MLLSVALVGCNKEETPPEEPKKEIPTESIFDNITFVDKKIDATKLKTWDIAENEELYPLNEYFIGSIKELYSTENPDQLLSSEYKIYNIYNDTVVSVTVNELITDEDPAYNTAVIDAEAREMDDFIFVYLIYGNEQVDIRLYNKYCVLVAEEKGVTYDDDIFDFDEEFNDDYFESLDEMGCRLVSILKKIYIVNETDFTISIVTDFNKTNFDFDEVVYLKEIDKFVSFSSDDITYGMTIFDKTLKIESAYEFNYSDFAEEIYVNFVAPTVAIYTEFIPLADDAAEYDAFYDGQKIDIQITKFDFATGEAKDIPVGEVVLRGYDQYYYDNSVEAEKYYGIKFNSKMLTSSYMTLENKVLNSQNKMVVFDEDLNVIKFIELPLAGSCEIYLLENGRKVVYTRFGVYELNNDFTIGKLISVEGEYNELWCIVDNERIYDNKGELIYTVPEGREIVEIMNNSLIISEDIKDAEGEVIGQRFFLWKGANNEAKIGDDLIDYEDESQAPTTGTLSAYYGAYEGGVYVVVSLDMAKFATGDFVPTVVIYDDLGNELKKIENVSDFDSDSYGNNDYLFLETTTLDAENNEIVKEILIALIHGEQVYFN